MSYSKEERDYYNKMRAGVCMRLGIKEHQYNWFRRKAEQLRKMYEDDCNGVEASQLYAQEAEEQELERLILDKAKSLQLFVYFQTDPRGASLYLSKNPIPENAYNTQAECIY